MRIAVTSQNRKTVTQHAGQCRKFWVYDVDRGNITGRTLLELGIDQSFHASHGSNSHPLDGVDVLITGSMGEGLFMRLADKGIQPIITDEADPDLAVTRMLMGLLKPLPVGGQCHGHDHDHHHH